MVKQLDHLARAGPRAGQVAAVDTRRAGQANRHRGRRGRREGDDQAPRERRLDAGRVLFAEVFKTRRMAIDGRLPALRRRLSSLAERHALRHQEQPPVSRCAAARVAERRVRDRLQRNQDSRRDAQHPAAAGPCGCRALLLGPCSPSGTWNPVASQVAAAQGRSVSENARALALLNMALSDALVAVFETKYRKPFWRPETAIPAGETDGNRARRAGIRWYPLQVRSGSWCAHGVPDRAVISTGIICALSTTTCPGDCSLEGRKLSPRKRRPALRLCRPRLSPKRLTATGRRRPRLPHPPDRRRRSLLAQ
jgi:hypothetical protein